MFEIEWKAVGNNRISNVSFSIDKVAIRYQIVISLSIFLAVSISAMFATVLTYRAFIMGRCS